MLVHDFVAKGEAKANAIFADMGVANIRSKRMANLRQMVGAHASAIIAQGNGKRAIGRDGAIKLNHAAIVAMADGVAKQMAERAEHFAAIANEFHAMHVAIEGDVMLE